MNRIAVKPLVWITGRGVILALRSIREKECRKSQIRVWCTLLLVQLQKFNKQEPVS